MLDLIEKESGPLEGGVRQCEKGAKEGSGSLFIAWTPLVTRILLSVYVYTYIYQKVRLYRRTER